MTLFSGHSTRIETPLLIQMEAVECGAACLGIVLGYYGKFVPIEELREACGVSRNGSSAYGIVTAASRYGLEGEGFSIGIDELENYAKPSILFWEFKHFVVYEGRDDQYFYLNDPATGPRKVDRDEFSRNFTGITLVFALTDNFKKGGSPPSFITSLKNRLHGVSSVLIYLIVLQFALAILNLIFPAMTKAFVDQIVVRQNMEWNGWFIGCMFVLTLLMFAFSRLQQTILYRTNIKLFTQTSADFIQRLFLLPLYFFQQRYSGDIANRTALNEKFADTLTGPFFRVISDVLLSITFGIALLFFDLQIGIITIFSALAIFSLLAYYHKDRNALYAGYQQYLAKNIGYSIGALESIETIKASGLESRVFARWSSMYTQAQNSLQSILSQDASRAAAARFLQLAAFSILLGLGSWHVITGKLTPGGLIAMQILLFNFLSPFLRLIEFNQELQLFKVDLSRLDDVMKYPLDTWYALSKDVREVQMQGKIEAKNVIFGFLPEEPILQDISLIVESGKSIAIIGPTGCGKSTLGHILSGLLTPWEGQVFIDDILLKNISKKSLTTQMFFLEQMNFLFQDTLRNNITLLDSEIDEKDIQKALQDACLDQFVQEREEGLELRIEEMGSNLSGGERQRVQIARALARNPKILLLDEAMSNLDAETEQKIVENILKRDCTLLLITHRISAMNLCDQVLVMENGKIIQKGSFTELKQSPGLYRKLLNYEQS